MRMKFGRSGGMPKEDAIHRKSMHESRNPHLLKEAASNLMNNLYGVLSRFAQVSYFFSFFSFESGHSVGVDAG